MTISQIIKQSTREFLVTSLNALTCVKNSTAIETYVDFCLSKNITEKMKGRTSSHHILPCAKNLPFQKYKSFKDNPWNKSELTFYDHYIAHYLLHLAIDHISVSHAFCSMHYRDVVLNRLLPEELIDEKDFTEVYKERNRKISIFRNSIVCFEGKTMTFAKRNAIQNARNITAEQREALSKVMSGENNIVNRPGVIESIRKTKSTTIIGGKNLDIISAERAAATMSRVFTTTDGRVTTIYKENAKKLSDYLNKEIVSEDGDITTVARIKARRKGNKMIEQGKFYMVKNVYDQKYEKTLPAIEVRKLSPGLEKKTKNEFLGKSAYGKSILAKRGKSHLIGLYVERLP